MNYQESISRLEEASVFGIKPGLERMQKILAVLGNPEKACKMIHITGTNGKGSVAAMITSVLENTNLRVGRFTSPHLIDYTERIYLGGKDISREDFAKAATVVFKAHDELIAAGEEALTEFELLTAIAFWYFRENKADYAVMEVGMGGRFDATNVVMPVVSVITNVAMDHMQYLGNTLQEIAREKAGIIKEGIPVVTAAQHVALKELKKDAHNKKARIYFYGRDFEIDTRNKWEQGQVVVVKRKGMPKELEKSMLFVPFIGAHQAVNAAVAAMALTILMKEDGRINENDLREGLARARWQGRFEIHHAGGKTVVLDGAHNEAGAEALQDKTTETIIQMLVRKGDKVYACAAPTPRTRTPEEICEMIDRQKIRAEHKIAGSVADALEKAVKEADENDIVLVCGSLYILGDAIRWLRKQELAE